MQTLVMFDIGNDRLRTRVIRHCRDHGLSRLQYSVFWGDLTEQRRERLAARVRESINRYTEKEDEGARQQQLVVHLFPVCADDIAKGVTLTREAVLPTQANRRESVLVV